MIFLNKNETGKAIISILEDTDMIEVYDKNLQKQWISYLELRNQLLEELKGELTSNK